MNEKDIFEAATELSKVGKVSAYICGPPPLLSFAETELLKAALTKNQIKYENWY